MPTAPTSKPAPRPAATKPAPVAGMPVMAPRQGLNFHRVLMIGALLSLWLAAGFFFHWNYVEVLLGDLPFTVLLGLGIVFTVWLAVQERGWLYLAAAISLSIIPTVVLFVFGAVGALGDPRMGGDFVGALFLLLTLALAVPAGIRGFVARRRNAPHAPLSKAMRTNHGIFAIGAVALVAGMAVAGTLAADASRVSTGGFDFAAADLGAESFTLTLKDYAFHGAVDVKAGKVTEIVLKNEDSAFHTFTYTKGGVEYNHDLVAGATKNILVLFPEPGTVKFRCVPHSEGYDGDPSESMVGTLNVTAAG